jgi:MFS family permease
MLGRWARSRLVDRVGILRPLRVRDFAFLWIGLTVSFIGDGVYIIAIAWQTYDLSNSPSALAAVGIAWSLPQVVLVLISGVLSDRVDRRLLMIAGDVIRGVAIATIGIMSIGGTLRSSLIVLRRGGAGQALFGPAFSSIAAGRPEELLVQANSLDSSSGRLRGLSDRPGRCGGRHRVGVRPDADLRDLGLMIG